MVCSEDFRDSSSRVHLCDGSLWSGTLHGHERASKLGDSEHEQPRLVAWGHWYCQLDLVSLDWIDGASIFLSCWRRIDWSREEQMCESVYVCECVLKDCLCQRLRGTVSVCKGACVAFSHATSFHRCFPFIHPPSHLASVIFIKNRLLHFLSFQQYVH